MNKNRKKVSTKVLKKFRSVPRGKIDFEIVFKQLKKKYPDAHCALNFKNAYELLIATILSAQCTDERVNKVTPQLFKRYPDAESMSHADISDIEDLVRSTGFFKNKAKNIKACCSLLVQKHNGRVPQTMEDMVELSGVGRKTANVVLGNAYSITSGIAVDTHVTRLTRRFGWVRTSDAVAIEKILMKMCPQKDWIMLTHYLIAHGRAICVARSPKCQTCFLKEACPKLGV